MTGVLCCEDPSKQPDRKDVAYNYIRRPGIKKLFSELLDAQFAVGIWSALPRGKLIPLLQSIVPTELYQQISFVWGRDMCGSPKNHTLCFKPLKTLLTKRESRAVCNEDQVLIVDDWPLRHMRNPELACIFPFSYMGQKGKEIAPNKSIGNIATELLPYLVPLRLYGTVSEYVKDHVRIGNVHHLRDQDRLYKRQRPPSFFFGTPGCYSN